MQFWICAWWTHGINTHKSSSCFLNAFGTLLWSHLCCWTSKKENNRNPHTHTHTPPPPPYWYNYRVLNNKNSSSSKWCWAVVAIYHRTNSRNVETGNNDNMKKIKIFFSSHEQQWIQLWIQFNSNERSITIIKLQILLLIFLGHYYNSSSNSKLCWWCIGWKIKMTTTTGEN